MCVIENTMETKKIITVELGKCSCLETEMCELCHLKNYIENDLLPKLRELNTKICGEKGD